MGFLNPLLLWGLPLCAVPIIIHLLNRRRFQVVRWAAIEFLLAAMKRNKRRLQMEQWLLLLLRTLLVAALVFLVARPQLSGGAFTTQRTHHVLVLDDSCSMLQRAGNQTVWRGVLDQVKQEVEKLALERTGDVVTLLRLSRPEQPDLAAVRVSAQLPARIRDLCDGFACSEGIGDLPKALVAARQRIEEAKEAAVAEIRLFSDHRRVDWLQRDGKARPELVAALLALDSQKHQVRIPQTLAKDQSNLAIEQILHKDRIAVVGMTCTFSIEVVNKGITASSPCDLAIEIDGGGRITKPLDAIDPGQGQTVTIQHDFSSAGFHGIVATLPTDSYAPDDKRALALEVRERSKALLVDGDPGASTEEAETTFVMTALEPGGDSISGIAPQQIADHALPDQDLGEIDTLWLCNVAAPSEQVVKKLEEFVGKGGGLVIFVGNQVEPSRYAQMLWKDGKGLLPLQLGDLVGDFDRPDPAFLSDRTHPLVASAPEALEFLLSKTVQVGRVFRAIEDPKRAVSIPIRVRDQHGPPLLVISGFGDKGGSVALCTTTADLAWSNWPKSFSYLPILNELHKAIAKPHSSIAYNLQPGGSLAVVLDAALYRPDVMVRDLGSAASERTFTAVPKREEENKLEVTLPMSELSGFGLFELTLTPHTGSRERRLLARNAPSEEGFVATVAKAGLESVYPPDAMARLKIDDPAQQAADRAQGELWRTLAWALLIFLLLETLLAWRFGRRSK